MEKHESVIKFSKKPYKHQNARIMNTLQTPPPGVHLHMHNENCVSFLKWLYSILEYKGESKP